MGGGYIHPHLEDLNRLVEEANPRYRDNFRRCHGALMACYAEHGRIEWRLLPEEAQQFVRRSKRWWDDNALSVERRRYWEMVGLDVLDSYHAGAPASRWFGPRRPTQ